LLLHLSSPTSSQNNLSKKTETNIAIKSQNKKEHRYKHLVSFLLLLKADSPSNSAKQTKKMESMRLRITVLLICIASSIGIMSQTSDKDPIIEAFQQANANSIASYLNDNVEMELPQTDNFYTKAQAKSILVDFFRKNEVKDFIVVHKGNRENSSFTIGTLSTSNGDFRILYHTKKSSGTPYNLIYQLRIEKTDTLH
jgi:hypothetical protein